MKPGARLRPILNSSLPPQFRQIRITLAREPGHPDGEPDIAYLMVAPFDADDHIDAKLWRKHRTACRVTRSRPDQEDDHGLLVHRPGGGWAIRYDRAAEESGFDFANERFAPCEYVSINEGGQPHTYRVVSVSHL
jgi:hypothetical protein